MAKSAIMSLRIVSDAKNAVSGLGKASSAVGKFAKLAGAAAIAAGGAALVAYGVSAVKMAGDLEQSVGAIDTVFKGSAKEMHKFASSASTDVGLTKNEFNELGTLIGTQLKNGGTAMDQLAPKTNQLIGLGADLSSMFGGTSKDAVAALSSALKGERDPIEKYGVSLKQSTIDAEAAALGFKKVGGSLSEEANQAATLSLIMKQTADAHGNFAKEANTLQGQQQRMSAGWKDIQTTLGGLLLPVMTAFFGFINTNVLPVIKTFTDQLAEGGLGGAFTNLVSFIEPVMSILGDIFAPLIPQVIALVTQLSPMSLIFQTLMPILPMLGDSFIQLSAVISTLLQAILPIVATLTGALIPVFTELIATVLPPLITVINQILSVLAPLIAALGAALPGVINALMPIVKSVFSIIQTVITTVLNVISGVISAFSAALRGDWSAFWEAIAGIARDIWNGIKSFAVEFFGGLPSAILGALGDLGGLLIGAGKAIIDGFLGGLRNAWEAGKKFIGGIGDWIKNNKGPISYDRKLLKPAGKAIMGGLTKSLKAAMPELARTVGEATQTINGLNASPTVDLRTRKPKPGTASAKTSGRNVTINVTFTGLVTDKVGTVREIRKLMTEVDLLEGKAV